MIWAFQENDILALKIHDDIATGCEGKNQPEQRRQPDKMTSLDIVLARLEW